MSYKKDLLYRDIPFSSETSQEDFFLYGAVSNLYSMCESNKNKIIKIRTVGILTNKHGRFYVKEINTAHILSRPPDPQQRILISMAYMNKSVACSSMPYPMQLFGRLQWCNHPVIFAQIIQPLRASLATLLQETMTRVCTLQSSMHSIDSGEPSLTQP